MNPSNTDPSGAQPTAELSAQWLQFVQACAACRRCALAETRKQVVVWRGAEQAPLM